MFKQYNVKKYTDLQHFERDRRAEDRRRGKLGENDENLREPRTNTAS
jgi:hypothetical protein